MGALVIVLGRVAVGVTALPGPRCRLHDVDERASRSEHATA